MHAPRDGHYRSGRLKLHFVEWGDPAAPPLLLLHGGRDHARSWDDVARALIPRWRVIAPDLRGHGDSDWATGGYGLFDFVADLAVLVDRIGTAPIPIVAHSLGGNIALRYTALFPERVSRLVAIEGIGPFRGPGDEGDDSADLLRRWIAERQTVAARTPRRYPDIAAAAARMRAKNPRLSEALAHHLTVHGTLADEAGGVRFKFDPATVPRSPIDLAEARKRALWARIACPLLLVYGRQSWASNPAEDGRLAAFPTARVAMFEDAGHWVQHDRYAAFVAETVSFLEADGNLATD